ncbi:hypothetical protein [Bailinhaonella thermotolerans]|uniref:Uncharacterized protein n=1 Tax=Bailinhaonella thermotolerans TaxID=1070861 RepID=A0A3A4A6Q3_9ACTN|nr:hypothetical protein [Bailinhaonella thermotolerans]RJL23549.1 hypothetical protein D5H75_32090 [Bailinhaonella thermotolerans]
MGYDPYGRRPYNDEPGRREPYGRERDAGHAGGDRHADEAPPLSGYPGERVYPPPSPEERRGGHAREDDLRPGYAREDDFRRGYPDDDDPGGLALAADRERRYRVGSGPATWEEYAEEPPRRRVLPIVLVVVAVLGAAVVGGYLLLGSSSPDRAPSSASSPGAGTAQDGGPAPAGSGAPESPAESPSEPSEPSGGPRPEPSGAIGHAASRATDPIPLTPKELFPRSKVGGFTLVAHRTDKKCKSAVDGDKISKAVAAAGCTQIVRASFQDAKGKILGTIGVVNLKDSQAAEKVAAAARDKKRRDYVKPLPGKSGAAKYLGTGEALAGAQTHGHYAVLLWFQFKDGHKPTAAERETLNRAAGTITESTVFKALDTRSLLGTPGN